MRLPPQVIEVLTRSVAKYIERNRWRYVGVSESLPVEILARFAPFFSAELLALARVAPARPRLLNPPFYSQLRALGIRRLPNLANVAAITFLDVIVYQVPLDETLAFHELVHVAQYQQLGLPGFAHAYVEGFLQGGAYENIPLERQAYDLDARFSSGGPTFSVADEVRSAVLRGDLGTVQ